MGGIIAGGWLLSAGMQTGTSTLSLTCLVLPLLVQSGEATRRYRSILVAKVNIAKRQLGRAESPSWSRCGPRRLQ
jgi:hypothetical protein